MCELCVFCCNMQDHAPKDMFTLLCCVAVLVCNELRSESVHAAFVQIFAGHFAIRTVPRKDLDAHFSSEHIHLLTLRRRRSPAADAIWPPAAAAHTGVPGGS